ncbi:MAG: YqaE/Pmp3 family membrane protein [Bacteroidia bacterium]|nr:YqaE/Pmp3 family membrane protein [Bacteroidia bacterium]
MIVLIILCFLWWLNLIAVYLHDGDITLNFWITLLLDLTFIGGVIFSLLVVLDVVNLA